MCSWLILPCASHFDQHKANDQKSAACFVVYFYQLSSQDVVFVHALPIDLTKQLPKAFAEMDIM